MYNLISVILYYAEDHLVYHPSLPSHSRLFVPRPSGFNLPYENIRYTSKDGTFLHMFFIHQLVNSDNVPTIVFFHGNAGNMGHRLVYNFTIIIVNRFVLAILPQFTEHINEWSIYSSSTNIFWRLQWQWLSIAALYKLIKILLFCLSKIMVSKLTKIDLLTSFKLLRFYFNNHVIVSL